MILGLDREKVLIISIDQFDTQRLYCHGNARWRSAIKQAALWRILVTFSKQPSSLFNLPPCYRVRHKMLSCTKPNA